MGPNLSKAEAYWSISSDASPYSGAGTGGWDEPFVAGHVVGDGHGGWCHRFASL